MHPNAMPRQDIERSNIQINGRSAKNGVVPARHSLPKKNSET